MKIKVTRRFLHDYQKAHLLRRACAHGALADMRRRYASSRSTFLRNYNKIKAQDPCVWEMDISGSDRLLFHVNAGVVYLVAMGGHEVVTHYQRTSNLEAELHRVESLPDGIARLVEQGFFTFDVADEWRTFACEAEASWLGYLDEEQYVVANEIIECATTQSEPSRNWNLFFVVGGPGTGKTAILLNVFARLIESDIIPEIVIADNVRDLIHDAGGFNLDGFTTTLSRAKREQIGSVLLVDDPDSLRELNEARWLAQSRQFDVVVVAFDPLQLDTDLGDDAYRQSCSGAGARLRELSVCYRQKRAVGEAALRALNSISRSSPYAADYKKEAYRSQHEAVTQVSNALRFVNPSGRVKVYPQAQLGDVRAEVDALLARPDTWTFGKPYLVAKDDEYLKRMPHSWMSELRRLHPSKVISLSDSRLIKGLEFQHALLVMSEELFLALEEGYDGATRAVHDKRRLYRIPFTRAKDSVITFVVSNTT